MDEAYLKKLEDVIKQMLQPLRQTVGTGRPEFDTVGIPQMPRDQFVLDRAILDHQDVALPIRIAGLIRRRFQREHS